VIDDEMGEIDLPAGPEYRLLLVQRKHLLDQDEDHARAEQVENEPVEADVRRMVGEIAHRHAVAAQGDGDHDQKQRCAVDPAVAQPHDIGKGDAARHHQAHQQDLAHYVDRILVPQLRRGQVLRKVESQHGEHAQDCQRQGKDAGRPPLRSAQRAGLVENSHRLGQQHLGFDRLHISSLRATAHSCTADLPLVLSTRPWRPCCPLSPSPPRR